MADEARCVDYSIAAVSKLAGVSCHALRVWERRYGFPRPNRSESGHRRYAADQVQTLLGIARLLREGREIGGVMADLKAGRIDFGSPAPKPEAPPAPSLSGELADQLIAGDLTRADAFYDAMTADLDPPEILDRLIEPAWVDVGDRLFRGTCTLSQERCASDFLRRKLDVLLDETARANARPSRTILLGTVQGDRHEGGMLMFAVRLELTGWRTIILGADMPVAAIIEAVDQFRPHAVGLSFVLSRNINKRFRELSRLRKVPVFVGGRSILNYQGLARRNGLIPLPGPAGAVIGSFLARAEAWLAEHA